MENLTFDVNKPGLLRHWEISGRNSQYEKRMKLH